MEYGLLADTRACEQCGSAFEPRREHARFCNVPCREAWNLEHAGDPGAGQCALGWSLTAMREATGRLAKASGADPARAITVVSEAVWWVTIVDATLVRHDPQAYDNVIAHQAPAQRQLIEETLAGLRFIRNQIGGQADLAEFLKLGEPGQDDDAQAGIAGWVWRPVPKPALASLSARGQAWEMTRYRAYQAHLASHLIGDTFRRAAAFLTLAAANATATNTSIAVLG